MREDNLCIIPGWPHRDATTRARSTS
jgi:hypothetical protein